MLTKPSGHNEYLTAAETYTPLQTMASDNGETIYPAQLVNDLKKTVLDRGFYSIQSLKEEIAQMEEILGDQKKVRGIIVSELQEIKKKYNTPRRTRLTGEAKDIEVKDLIAEENMVVTMTKAGYIKRLPVSTYRQQKRGGKGMSGVKLKENDFVEQLFIASTHDYMLFFTNKGKVYRQKVHQIPLGSRQAKGTPVVNLLPIEDDEQVATVLNTRDFPADEYLLFATAHGMIKKTAFDAYKNVRSNGLIAINLRDADELIAVRRVAPGMKVMMVSSAGKAIRFDESEARPMGRDTTGVHGIRIDVAGGDRVLGMEIAPDDSDLFVITERGYGKRTKVTEYTEHHRGGGGMSTIKMTDKKGMIAAMKIINEKHEMMIVSEEGVVIRVKAGDISELSRATQGVKVMNVDDSDRVVAVARVAAGKKKKKEIIEGQTELLTEEISGQMKTEVPADVEDDIEEDEIDTTD